MSCFVARNNYRIGQSEMEEISELAGGTIECRDEFINVVEITTERSDLVTTSASRELLATF